MHLYSYLFPNKKVPARVPRTWQQTGLYDNLRTDGKPCYAAILAICRRINDEACDALYGEITYKIEVDGQNLRACLGRRSGYNFVRSQSRSSHINKTTVIIPSFREHRGSLFTHVKYTKDIVRVIP